MNLPVHTLEEWEKKFKPKNPNLHWKHNYSALEFADAVISESFDKEIKSHLKLSDSLVNTVAQPECKTRFDDLKGECRNHDLACIFEDKNTKVAICIEAKVKEDLGKKVTCGYIEEIQRKTPNSKRPERIHNLWKYFFNEELPSSDMDNDIFYQILTALAGTIAYASDNKIDTCYFVLYQLYPDNYSTKCKYRQKHIEALNSFIRKFKESHNYIENKTFSIDSSDNLIDLGNMNYKGSSIHVYMCYMEKEFKEVKLNTKSK